MFKPVVSMTSTKAAKGKAKPGFFRAYRERLKNRPDSEHEMTINRMVFATLVVLYLIIGNLIGDDQIKGLTKTVGIASLIYYLGALALFAHILIQPGISRARRVLAILLDLWTVSYGAYTGGETMAFFYPLYLWTILGNGFRFGVGYLRIAMAMSLIGLTAALVATGFWDEHRGLSVGLLSGLLILPLYASNLIRKLSAAKRQAEEASRAKSLFLASISHELRTPLNVIIGVSDLLKAYRFDREQNEMVRMIGTSGRSLLGLINSILDFSRLEAGQMPSQLSNFDLFALLGQIRALMAVQANAKGLQLGLFVSAAVPHLINGDRRHIEEILVNLTGNAVKFTDSGHVQIAVRVAGESEGKARLRFEVRDTGIGIAPTAQKQIFESFTQADETIIDRFGGTGLGLAICRQLVELHGGEIGLDSTIGQGSTFWFEIEFDKATGVQSRPALSNARLLIVSDDHRLLAMAGELAGDVRVATSQLEACETLHRMRGENIEAIIALVDQRLCESDTLEVAGTLLAEDPKHRVILIHVAEEGQAPSTGETVMFASSIPRPFDREILSNAFQIAMASEAGGMEAEEAEEIADARRAFRILVAEDNRTNQMIIRKVLERAGHAVTLVDNGEEALNSLREEAFDVVLMDINMPVMNGIEASKLYRFMSVGRDRIPIIALTADATPEASSRCAEAGMDACLTKPIDAGILLRTLDDLVPVAGETARTIDPDSGIILLESHPRFQPTVDGGLNLVALDELLQLGGTGFIAELVEEFTREAEVMLQELHLAVAEDDLHAFGERIHALRSCAANIGAQSVFERCVTWRDITAEELSSHGEEYLHLLQQDFEAAVKHLNAFLTVDHLKTGTN